MPATQELEKRIGHCFADPSLLQTALTHPSYAQHDAQAPNNQRLEFLGDAVISLVVAEKIGNLFRDELEGFLSNARAMLVGAPTLSELAGEIGLADHMRVADHEDAHGARQRENLRADAFEALIGALFLDAGYDTARAVLLNLFGDLKQRLDEAGHSHNARGKLQEWKARHPEYPEIEYVLVGEDGPAHARSFHVEVRAGAQVLGAASAPSKRLANARAAAQALEKIGGAGGGE